MAQYIIQGGNKLEGEVTASAVEKYEYLDNKHVMINSEEFDGITPEEPITQYESTCKGAIAYNNLAKEVMNRG